MLTRTLAFVAYLLAGQAVQADWPGFRGPNHQGHGKLDDGPPRWEILWKAKLPGPGASSPIVTGDRVLLTSFTGVKSTELVRYLQCFDRTSGKLLWEAKRAAPQPENNFARQLLQHGFTTATPVTDGERVFVYYGRGGAAAYDLDGKELWARELGKYLNTFGSGGSPSLYGNLLLVNAAVESGSIYALNKTSGETVWRARLPGDFWSTPVTVDVKGTKEIVVNGLEALYGLDPDSGKELWNCESVGGYVSSNPVIHDDVIYTIGVNHGGQKAVTAVRAGGRGDVSKTHVLWKNTKLGASYTSPLLIGDRLFFFSGMGYCVDRLKGELLSQKRLEGVTQLYSSPVYAGGHIYLFTRNEGAYVLSPDEKMDVIAHHEPGDRSAIQASPAVSHGCLFIRSNEYLYAIKVREPACEALMRPLFCIPLVLLGLASPAVAQPYDLVVRGGKIVDGTGNPWFLGDVAIKGDRIAAVGRIPGPAKREIDARGLVVAPGFIDMHSHSDFLLLEDGNAQSKIRQGVTTEVLGESGSPGPYQGKLTPPKVGKGDDRWTTLGGYFESVERSGISTNVASFVGLGNVWRCVMGNSHERPTAAQLEQMKALIEEAMKDGACGLSCSLAMPPDALATTDDIVELCKVVARYGGRYLTHIRNEGTGVFEAIREAIEIGRRAGVAVEILHIKIADQLHWGRMSEVVKLVEDARKAGINVQANIYPYTRGNNNLSSILPPWVHEGGTAKMLERLQDPALRERMKKDIRGGIAGWYNHFTAVGGDWSRMLISANNAYKGLTMDRVLAIRTKGKQPTPDELDAFFDLLLDEGGSVSTVYDHHTEKDMNLALVQPWVSIGSDGLAYAAEGPLRRGHPHPRSFGTFPRVLGVYVRERGLLPLEVAVRKMTSQNALKIGILDRGVLRPGMFADLTLFDPERVIDRATYEEPFRYPEGIEYVMVNGQLVLEQGRHTGARPGRALRGSR